MHQSNIVLARYTWDGKIGRFVKEKFAKHELITEQNTLEHFSKCDYEYFDFKTLIKTLSFLAGIINK